MAVFKRLSDSEIRENFTHYGRFVGLVPCYVADDEHGGMRLEVRNWWPDFLLDVGQFIYGLFITAMTMVDEDYEPAWSITITGEIE